MLTRFQRVLMLFALILAAAAGPVWAADDEEPLKRVIVPPPARPLKIVTSQALYADLVKKIGGDRVEVSYIASPKFNVHFVQPRPSDVRKAAQADLVVYAGLDLEAWWEPLLEAAGRPDLFPGRHQSVDLSKGVRLLNVPKARISRSEGDLHLYGNPHYAMNPENMRVMAQTLADKLKVYDPPGAQVYDENAALFKSRLDGKIEEWRSWCGDCWQREIVSYHDDVAYLADFLGLKSELFIEPKPGIPPTPKHLEQLESAIRQKGVRAIVLPTFQPRDAADRLASRTGAKVTTICQNAGEVPGTEDVFGFYEHNYKRIAEALGSASAP